MGKLVLSFQGKILGEYPLDRERITIGRHPDNDIRIENLAVSGHHAAVLTILNDAFIEDLDSTNGTLVNGRPIKKHALRNGDVITIGKHELRYVADPAAAEDLEKTVVIRPQAAAALGAGPAAAATPPPARLQVLNGPHAGRELALTKALTTIGRPGVQVAAISRRPQGYYIVHVDGADGRYPVVNGTSIGPQARRLEDGDTIEIAGTKMGFFLGGAD
ncbi:FHA domain-containing protein [Inmirania thermothiophila]|uniref:FHA domain-containing protein n=1 Tax=Inmirania thermothiophila TaxID=1750597 RepID=A0A3N1YBA2_9GAMM|nr:FHA domain-containing protein [Inmirania thermothiophila]ROR34677.1 FHA domain-containing protein [Inmirania thermothiophila]